MARYRDAAAVFGVPPDFVAAFGLAVEDEAGATKFAQHVAGGETGETAHQEMVMGMRTSTSDGEAVLRTGGSGSPCSM